MTTEKKGIRTALKEYVRTGQVQSFDYDFVQKLALVQKTPKEFVKTRKVNGKDVPYLPHVYCRKLLNFLFDFNISTKVESSEYHFYQDLVYNKDLKKKVPKDVVEADVQVQFLFTRPNGFQVVRTVTSSHKMYKNVAIGYGDAKKAAVSKAWTQVAKTFGIGDDIKLDQVVELNMDYIESEPVYNQETSQVKKSFEFDYNPSN